MARHRSSEGGAIFRQGESRDMSVRRCRECNAELQPDESNFTRCGDCRRERERALDQWLARNRKLGKREKTYDEWRAICDKERKRREPLRASPIFTPHVRRGIRSALALTGALVALMVRRD